MNSPLVSIICLCYNHEQYVEESILSALNQDYENIEIIAVDDASTDGSRNIIDQLCEQHASIKKLYLDQNVGNTKAFNHGLGLARGEFLIDLATDDVLLPNRVSEGIKTFERCSDRHGVNFSNAELIDEEGSLLKHFYEVDIENRAVTPPEEGDIFASLIERFMICSPTMMFKREVMDELNGYDETLAYEDFDFWIRSSRKFLYCFTDLILVKKRKVLDSMSNRQYAFQSYQMRSTFKVLNKANQLVASEKELRSLKGRLRLEMKQCVKHFQWKLLMDYWKLLRQT